MHKEVKPLSSDVEKIVDGPSYPLELLTTKFGSMKLALLGHCFEFHFNRKGFKFWKCLNHTKGCEARAVSRNNLVYPLDLNHNHDEDPYVKDALPLTNFSKPNVASVSAPASHSIPATVAISLSAAPMPPKFLPKLTPKFGLPITLRPASAVVSAGNKSSVDNQQLKDKMKQRLAVLGVNLTSIKKEK